MRILGLDLERLISIVEASKIDGLEVKGGFRDFFQRVKIEKREGAPIISCYLPPPPVPTKKERNMKKREELKYQDVTSPGIGVFYTTDPRIPKAKPYIKNGSKIKEGDVVGIIQHYGNLYTEIYSPFNGRVREFYILEGQAIDFGRPLVKVRVKN